MARPIVINLKAQTEGEFRTETLLGKEYLVVPVVAMVEGVRFGANQTSAELGLAEDFAKNLISWANKPLVLNHPKQDDVFVSANIPSVLEEYCFGITMNPQLEKDKLKVEAWIDKDRAKALGGEFETILNDLQSAEVYEVSVGFFSDIEQVSGKFRGQKFSGIWKNIIPDHLAILSKGIIGACSVEDGCGIPRINEVNTMAEINTQCACEDEPKGVVLNKPKSKTSVPSINGRRDEESLVALEEGRKDLRDLNAKIITQQIDGMLMDFDVVKLIRVALKSKFGAYTYVYGFTSEYAIYEVYDYAANNFRLWKIGVNVSENSVEFVGDPSEVILLTKIVSVTSETGMNTQETTMTAPIVETPAPVVATTPVVVPAPAITVEASAPKVLTADEYIAQAPAGVREVLQAAIKAQETKKAELVKVLKDSGRSKFTDEYLNAQTAEMLENLVALAAPSYVGTSHAAPLQVNTDNIVPMPPKAFERKTA